MDNKATSWIHAGIKVLGRNGKLELNSVCRERGKFRPSFYHIYPNFEDSKGLDRFEDDVLQHHERVMLAFFGSNRRIYILYDDYHKAIQACVDLLADFLDYHKCSAQIRKLSETNQKMKAYWDRLYPEYLKIVNEFNKVYKFPEDPLINDHAIRLMFDAFLTSSNKGEYLKDAIDIAYTSMRLRGVEATPKNTKS